MRATQGSNHVLVVGGTGMLREVTLELARRGFAVSVVARSRGPLCELARSACALAGTIHPVAVDYRSGSRLRAALVSAVKQRGPVTLVVSWIHSDAPEAARIILMSIASPSRQAVRYFDIRGMAWADPSHESVRPPTEPAIFQDVAYRCVVLGFVLELGRSRWLTDHEISSGVLSAVERDEPRHVVGCVEPWSLRPNA